MRATERKRKPFMTGRKWTVLILFIIALIITCIALFYSSIQKEQWQEKRYVVSSLREYFNTDTISYADKYVWDESYWIVKGLNKQEIEMIVVWKELNIVYSAPTSELLTKELFVSNLKQSNSQLNLDHIRPAFVRDELSFEVQTYNETGHKVISFYSMENGQLVEQYQLPK